jgi:excisionase family DNA binding protein
MPVELKLDDLIDLLAERLAERVGAKLGDSKSNGGARLLPVEQAASYLGRSEDAIRHLIASGKLPVVRSDKRIFLDIQDLDRWISENKQ